MVAVEVEDGEVALAAALAGRGLAVIQDGRALLVEIDAERGYDVVRDAVADLGLALVRLEPRRRSLEDLFRDDAPAAAAVPSATAGGRVS